MCATDEYVPNTGSSICLICADGSVTNGQFAAIGHGVDVVTGRKRHLVMPKATFTQNKTFIDANAMVFSGFRNMIVPDAVDAATQCTL